jgi:hypothetical protein
VGNRWRPAAVAAAARTPARVQLGVDNARAGGCQVIARGGAE